MNNKKFQQMIEVGNLQGLKNALSINPELANKSIEWYLNQNNQSDPLHYVCDCVFNGWLDEAKAYEITELLIECGALIEGTTGRESPLIAATSLGVETVAKLLIQKGAELEVKCNEFGATPLYWAAFGFGPNGPNKKERHLNQRKFYLRLGPRLKPLIIKV